MSDILDTLRQEGVDPALLTAALEETFGVPAAEASILRTHFLTAEKTRFA